MVEHRLVLVALCLVAIPILLYLSRDVKKKPRPPKYTGIEIAPGMVAHVSKDVQPETIKALQEVGEIVVRQNTQASVPPQPRPQPRNLDELRAEVSMREKWWQDFLERDANGGQRWKNGE